MAGCSTKSLVTERYDEDVYRIDDPALPDSEARYSFLVYGDTQSGWRAERSIQSEKWPSWKQLDLPVVYPLYLIGKGLRATANASASPRRPRSSPRRREEEPAAAAGASSSAHRLFSRTTDLPGL